MTLASDLIAARRLIDTPEEFALLGVVGACNAVLVNKTQNRRGIALLRKHGGLLLPSAHDMNRQHQAVLGMFDRAIAAAEWADKP